MIKIAIAGSSGFAQYIAHFLNTQTSHPFIILSRNPNQALVAKGWQVVRVNYDQPAKLRYALAGVDTVISTISGTAELNLIDAAAQSHVRRFVPSEFEGPPGQALASELLDRGNSSSLARLYHYHSQGVMSYTVFVCGIFYERFAPGGMAVFQIGRGTHIDKEGSYILDIRSRTARVLYPSENSSRSASICMTSAQDAARFIVAALALDKWPTEFRMCGDRTRLTDLVRMAESTFGQQFTTSVDTPRSLQSSITRAGSKSEVWQLHHLLATASGSYDYEDYNIHALIPVQAQSFRSWIRDVWLNSGY